jgi:ElaB/YqjD/DUF883 family membrane-anchored ribosome-binding protein
MNSYAQEPGVEDILAHEAASRAEIEAQIARVRAELAALGGMMKDYGNARLRGAEYQAVEELQRQLATLEAGVRRKMYEQPLQVLGMAAFAGLVLGLIIRR